MNLFSFPDPKIRLQLEDLITLIEKTFPVPRRFANALPQDIGELSGLFTSRRNERSHSYLGRPNLLSAYLRYFLPWNIFRLCRLLPSLPLDFKDGDIILDIGSGPLTFTLALWICRPDLRDIALQFICLEPTPSVTEAGKKLFAAFSLAAGAGNNIKWKIKTLRGELTRKGFRIAGNKKWNYIPADKIMQSRKAALVAAVNVFNEIFWELPAADREGKNDYAQQSAFVLAACAGSGSILVIEPGIPHSGEFISCLRSFLIAEGFSAASPCTHQKACPFPGGFVSGRKAKWCHFSMKTADAPSRLLKLSLDSGIPKEKAVLSFLLVSKKNSFCPESLASFDPGIVPARITSDPFSVGTNTGRYACSDCGAVLVLGMDEIRALDSGACIKVKISGRRDKKSGALAGELMQ